MEKLMNLIDNSPSGEINYTEFIIASIDKESLINE